MASSGTVASPALNLIGSVGVRIDFRYKPPRGREGAMIAGRTKIKSTAVIEAGDLELRTIKTFRATPYYIEPTAAGTYLGGPAVLYGSVNALGSLMNAVTLTTLKGSHNPLAGGVGTAHTGTVPGGSIQLGFLALGA